MDATMGQLVYLPAGVAGPDPDAFLSDVLTGWRRAQLAQNFSAGTARRRVASVLRMGNSWVLIRGSGRRPMPMISSVTCVVFVTSPIRRCAPTKPM